MIPNTIPYTRQLSKAAQREQDCKDVIQNITRVAKAIVFSPKHLVDQVLTGHADWIDPSRHEERMAQRVAIEQPPTLDAYQTATRQQLLDHNRKIGAAVTAEERFVGPQGCEDENKAGQLQAQADWAMLTLLGEGGISDDDYQRFKAGREGLAYAQLPNTSRMQCLPDDLDKRFLCQARIGQHFIDLNWAANQAHPADAVSVASATPYLNITSEDIKLWREVGEY